MQDPNDDDDDDRLFAQLSPLLDATEIVVRYREPTTAQVRQWLRETQGGSKPTCSSRLTDSQVASVMANLKDDAKEPTTYLRGTTRIFVTESDWMERSAKIPRLEKHPQQESCVSFDSGYSSCDKRLRPLPMTPEKKLPDADDDTKVDRRAPYVEETAPKVDIDIQSRLHKAILTVNKQMGLDEPIPRYRQMALTEMIRTVHGDKTGAIVVFDWPRRGGLMERDYCKTTTIYLFLLAHILEGVTPLTIYVGTHGAHGAQHMSHELHDLLESFPSVSGRLLQVNTETVVYASSQREVQQKGKKNLLASGANLGRILFRSVRAHTNKGIRADVAIYEHAAPDAITAVAPKVFVFTTGTGTESYRSPAAATAAPPQVAGHRAPDADDKGSQQIAQKILGLRDASSKR